VLERRADLTNLFECHLIESFEDLVIFELRRALFRVAVVRLLEIAFNLPGPTEQVREPAFQLRSYSVSCRHHALLNRTWRFSVRLPCR